jgi:hypothetical protein
MKAVFAKMLEKNPTQSSTVAFRAGGNGVPILTRASGQSTTGYQTMGLPDGSRPMPGGGANKTVLGIYRMGEADGNGAPSAIIGNPGDIFSPIELPDRVNPERTFANVGNNVFQPQGNDLATIALLKRLGDQQFKAVSQAPFEDYRAQQRLARDLEEASRNASLNDLGMSREIIRNLAAERRQQNEDDYLRKMLDAGATPEAARKEIEDVRNANAIQEAKKVEDRSYQAKTLISRIAMARGVTPMVREPLNQSSSIDNPQRSQAMSEAMGMPGEGFGTSPLDMNRQFMTPDFYKKFLRRSTVSQEASDEASAFSNLLTGAGNEDQLQNLQSGFSMATLKGQERQQQVEIASEALASRLDALRQRQNRIKLPLPRPAVGKDIIDMLYKSKTKVAGNRVLYSPETIHDLNPLQLLLSINFNVQQFENGFQKLTNEVRKYTWGSTERPSDTWLIDLKKVALAMNRREQDVRIPFASASLSVPTSKYIDLLNDIKQGAIPQLRRDIEQGRVELMREINADELPLEGVAGPPLEGRGAVNTTRSRRRLPAEVAPQLEVLEMAQPPVPGAPNVGGGGAQPAVDPYAGKTKAQLKALLREAGLNQGGNLDELKARLRRGTNN